MAEGSRSTHGYLLAALAAVGWSTMGVLGKLLFTYQASPLTVVTLRAIVAALTLVAALGLLHRQAFRLRPRDILFFAGYGLIGVACAFFFFFTAVELVGVAIATVLLYCYPAIVTALSAVFLGEHITRRRLLALALTLTGVTILSDVFRVSTTRVDPRGVTMALLAALSAAAYSILGRHAVRRHSPWTVLLYSFGFGALFLTTGLLVVHGIPRLDRPPGFWGLLLALAWIPTLGAGLAYVSALARIGASRASITATIEPVAASVLAYAVFHERLTPAQILGGLVVLAGVVVAQAEPSARPGSLNPGRHHRSGAGPASNGLRHGCRRSVPLRRAPEAEGR